MAVAMWMTAAVDDRRNRWPDDDDDDSLIAFLPKADDTTRLSSSSSGHLFRCNKCYGEKIFALPAARLFSYCGCRRRSHKPPAVRPENICINICPEPEGGGTRVSDSICSGTREILALRYGLRVTNYHPRHGDWLRRVSC